MGVNTKAKKATKTEQIVDLLSSYESLTAEANALMAKHGITEMLAEAADAKKKATELVVSAKLSTVPMPDGTRYDLRRDSYNKQIVGDDEELAAVKSPAAVIPLKTIIKAKYGKGGKNKLPWTEIWKMVTTRRVDVAKLEDAVKKGILVVDEIQPAYYQDYKAPYLRKY